MAGFGVVVLAVTPCADSGCLVTDMGIGICIEQPNRYVQTLYFFDMVFVLEHLGKQQLSFVMILQGRNGSLFVYLEGDHQIRLQRSGELSGHDHGVATERTLACAGGLIGHDLAAAAVAGVDPQALSLALCPFGTGGDIPGHVFLWLRIHLCLIRFQVLQFKFGAAVGAFHFLQARIKLDGAVTAGTFEFL